MSAILRNIEHAPHAAPPEPLLPEMAAPAPFPLEALPPILRGAAKAIAEHVKAPIVLAAHAVIGAAVHLAQARINAPHLHKPDGMPCSLFLLTLGDSGDRKSECQRLAFRVIDETEREARNEWQDECSVLKAEHRREKKSKGKPEPLELPPDPRTIYASDASFSKIVANFIHGQSYASWSTDEGGQFFSGHSMVSDTRTATLGGLVKLFDNGTAERDRASNNMDGSGFAYGRRLSILLLAQDIAVRGALSDPLLRGQGFLPRFLFASAQSLAGTRFLTAADLDRKSYADARLQKLWERCRDILDATPVSADESGALMPPVITMTEDATAVWLDFYNRTEGAQAALQALQGLKPFASRAGELARRLAAVLAFFEQHPSIDADTMHSACEIVGHSLLEWARYTDAARIDPTAQTAHDLMQWLRNPKRAAKWQTFTRDEIGKSGPPVMRNAARRDRVLSLLIERHHLTTADGKRFLVALPADFAETAESLMNAEFPVADDLRRPAENRVIEQGDSASSAKIRSLPQTFRSPKARQHYVSAKSAESAAPPNTGTSADEVIEGHL